MRCVHGEALIPVIPRRGVNWRFDDGSRRLIGALETSFQGDTMKLETIMAGPINGYTAEAEENKAAFHREGRRELKKLAQALNLEPDDYDVRSNKAGIAVSGEVTLHTEEFYVQLSDSCVAPVMYRLCDGRKDFRGKSNHWAAVTVLSDPMQFAETLQGLRS